MGALYQTVAAIVHQNQHESSDGDALDATLLDILSDPLSLSLEQAEALLDKVREFYWAKDQGNCTASPGAALAGRPSTPVAKLAGSE
jgi:hypothetical protein